MLIPAVLLIVVCVATPAAESCKIGALQQRRQQPDYVNEWATACVHN